MATIDIDPTAAIAFIGGGNMARSLIGGLIKAGVPASRIHVAEPDTELRATLARDFGVNVGDDNTSAARTASIWLLAVKPQVMKTVCTGLCETSAKVRPLVISIAAGVRIAQMENWLGANTAIVRCMPNTPALIGAGASGLCANAHVVVAQRHMAERILGAAGMAEWIHDETLMDTVTALSGSGPAYFFALVEALENAAAANGLPRETARALAIQTCFGAGRMLRESGEAPAELRRRVTSPGGTTAAALEAFQAGGLNELVARAVAAAAQRGAELSAELGD